MHLTDDLEVVDLHLDVQHQVPEGHVPYFRAVLVVDAHHAEAVLPVVCLEQFHRPDDLAGYFNDPDVEGWRFQESFLTKHYPHSNSNFFEKSGK